MTKKFSVKLSSVELKRHEYDLLKFYLVYQLNVDHEFCSWDLTKFKPDFVKLNGVLPTPYEVRDFASTFPFWSIKPNEDKIAKHQALVEDYVSFLNNLDDCPAITDFLEIDKHDVLTLSKDILKDLRVNIETEVKVWDMLNSCDEDLILTEKQLHSLNCCASLVDLQIPFLELRKALENIENVKIIGTDIGSAHRYKPLPNLDVSHFLSLTSLTLKDIDFKGITEFGFLCETLQDLTVSANIQEVSEILIWVEENGPVAWQHLEKLDLSNNEIITMDESLQMLIHLTSLNLSHNKINEIENIEGLPYLDTIDLSYNSITDVDSLHLKMGNITKLNLAHNQIKFLQGLEKLYSLQNLDLTNNSITQFNELNRLTGLPQLEKLSLLHNAIDQSSTYRVDVLTLFINHDNFTLDKVPCSVQEKRKLLKKCQKKREVDVYLEEPICVIEIGHQDLSLSEEIGEVALDLTFSDVNLSETHYSVKRSRIKKSRAPITELQDIDEAAENVIRPQVTTILEVERMLKVDRNNWLNNFMEHIEFSPVLPSLVQANVEPIIEPDVEPIVVPSVMPKVVEVSAESLKNLEQTQPLLLASKPGSETRSYTTENSEASRTSKDSRESRRSTNSKASEMVPARLPIRPKIDVNTFHIVPNEVYNIDEKLDDLVARFSDLPFSELMTTYSVYRDEILYVLGLNPNCQPDKPELIEVTPKGGLISWSILPQEIETCDLIEGDRILIKKYGDDAPRVYSQLFLKDMAHLYLLVLKMRLIEEVESSEESSRASDRVFWSTVELGVSGSETLHTFPTHCFRYCNADAPIPAVFGITDEEIFIIRIENYSLLNLNQDMLSQILMEDTCQMTLIVREKITSVRQILRSYFHHTLRLEFKEQDGSPFGNPNTTFSLLGYNSSDIEMFIDTIACKLDDQTAAPELVLITEQEGDLRTLKRALREQDLQQIKCISIRLEGLYFRSLIMTENFLFILEEDFVRWPPPCFVRHPPLTPRYSIVEQIRTRYMFGLTLYTEIYHGSYVLSLNYYKNLKTFERGRRDILISSFENREQIVGHIKRTWRQYYQKDVIVSTLRCYDVQLINKNLIKMQNNRDLLSIENFSTAGLDVLQRFTAEQLHDSYNIIFHCLTYCIYSVQPGTEYNCAVIMTAENVHILISAARKMETRISENFSLLFSHSVTNICQIVSGIFDQKIRFEFGYETGMVTFMTRKVEDSRGLQRAAMEALHCQYQNDSYENDEVLITRKGREISIIHMDDDRLDELRYTIAKHAGIEDYNDVQILGYYLLYQVIEDKKIMTTAVVTNSSLFLINEDNVFWPLPQSNEHKLPTSVQFQMVEGILLEDIMCAHYSHFTSCDIILLYENTDNGSHLKHGEQEEHYYMIEAVEKLGKTVCLHTTTYQQRDQLIRTLAQLKGDELPVKKLED